MAKTMTKVDIPVQARARAKYVRSSPRKAQIVAEQIRGLPVAEARTVLAFSKRAAARDVEKVLASAVANAEANHDLIGDELFVREAYVGEGPVLKRWRARARGRVGRIHKRTSHIVVGLAELDEELRALYAEQSVDQLVDDVDASIEGELSLEDQDSESGETADNAASDIELKEVSDAADDQAEPYKGYAGHTAKEVIKELPGLANEQLALVADQDKRVTVQRAVVKEQARREEISDEGQEG